MSPTAIPAERAALVKSIHDLADYLERCPDLPIGTVTATVPGVTTGKTREQIMGLVDNYGFNAASEGSIGAARYEIGQGVGVVAYFMPQDVLVPSIEGTTVRWSLPTTTAGLEVAA